MLLCVLTADTLLSASLAWLRAVIVEESQVNILPVSAVKLNKVKQLSCPVARGKTGHLFLGWLSLKGTLLKKMLKQGSNPQGDWDK